MTESEERYDVKDYMINHLTYKTYPVSGYDIYEVKIYYKSALIGSIKVDGMEVECFRHEAAKRPTLLCAKGKNMKKFKVFIDEVKRLEGWD